MPPTHTLYPRNQTCLAALLGIAISSSLVPYWLKQRIVSRLPLWKWQGAPRLGQPALRWAHTSLDVPGTHAHGQPSHMSGLEVPSLRDFILVLRAQVTSLSPATAWNNSKRGQEPPQMGTEPRLIPPLWCLVADWAVALEPIFSALSWEASLRTLASPAGLDMWQHPSCLTFLTFPEKKINMENGCF